MRDEATPVRIPDHLLEIEAVPNGRHQMALKQDRVLGQTRDVGQAESDRPSVLA